MNQVLGLNEDQLRRMAPSIFSETPQVDVSSRYQFIPTINMVQALQKEGWYPTKAQECAVRLDSHRGFQKHLIRFQREDLVLNGEAIEVVLINSHNRSAAYQLMAGVYRMICSNGMIVGDTFGRVSVKHINFDPAEVIEASCRVIENAPEIAHSMQEMKLIELTQPEREIYAESAALVLYDEKQKIPFETRKLLQPKRRYDGDRKDLWSTFNIVQENIIKGGVRGYKTDELGHFKRSTTRKIKSIDRDVKVNKALWNLTEKMKELKN